MFIISNNMEHRYQRQIYLLQFISIAIIWLWLVYAVLDVVMDVVEQVTIPNTPGADGSVVELLVFITRMFPGIL